MSYLDKFGGFLICTIILVMGLEYVEILNNEGMIDTYIQSTVYAFFIIFCIAANNTFKNAKKIEGQKSRFRKKFERKYLLTIMLLWCFSFLIHFKVIELGSFEEHSFSVLLSFSTGILVKLLEKELDLRVFDDLKPLHDITVLCVGMLVISMCSLSMGWAKSHLDEVLSYLGLSVSSAVLFIHISRLLDEKYMRDR